MSTRVFPIDPEAIRAYGIDAWQRECVWPVPEHEFAALCDRIEDAYAYAVHACPGLPAEALLVKRALAVEYWHFLHAVIAIARLRRAGYTPSCAASAPWYHALLSSTLNATTDVTQRRKPLAVIMQSAAFGHTATQTIRCLAWTARLNITARKSFLPSRAGATFISIGIPSEQCLAYAQRSTSRLSVSWIGEWVSRRASRAVTPAARLQISDLAALLTERLQGIAGAYGVPLVPEYVRYLRQLTEYQLTDAAIALQVIRLRDGAGESHLLLGSPGDQTGRALALRFRVHGRHVTSVAHGGSLGLFDSPTMAVNEFALSDTFVTMTAGSATLFRRILAAHEPLGGHPVTIVAGSYGAYAHAMRGGRERLPPRAIRRVMLVGYPHAPWRRPQGAAQFSSYMVDVEVKLIRALRDGGYTVSYKAHPDRLREAMILFSDLVPVIAGDLRQHLDSADAFVFSSIRTTAFHFALCTVKPVVGLLVEPDRYPLFSDVRALLARRCALIPLTFGDRGFLEFDRSALLDALAASPDIPDASFIEQYLSPIVCNATEFSS